MRPQPGSKSLRSSLGVGCRRWAGLGAAALGCFCAAPLGCANHEHAPPPEPSSLGGAAAAADGGIVIDASPKPGEPLCGDQVIAGVTDPPNLYFIVDRSGSMGDSIDNSGLQKYAAARRAIGSVLDVIGSRVAYGAALFPATDFDGSCDVGRQVYPLTLGDAPSRVPLGGRGPILTQFLNRLAAFNPGGATPTAATLAALTSTLTGLPQKTSVVLVTDGAPNCNTGLRCKSSDCIPDIDGSVASDGRVCGRDLSCCDTTLVTRAGGNCIDADATVDAVTALAAAGVQTFVVGMPGSAPYAELLDRAAKAGATTRSTYYAVTDAEALQAALLQIGTGIAVGCDLSLEKKPENPELLNLYLDGSVVPQDPDSGWTYSGEAAVSLHGDACQALRSGNVREVEITYGCRTVVR